MRLIVVSFFLWAILGGAQTEAKTPLEGAGLSSDTKTFVDFDGDGLDDNVGDLDHDGLPDFVSDTDEPEPPDVASDFFKAIETTSSSDDLFLTPSEKFGALKFSTRALTQNRGCFSAGSEFGPPGGLGQSTSSGGCAGGICW